MNKSLSFMLLGICLVVIGGCQSNKDSVKMKYSGYAAFGKKACLGEDPKKWDNCAGTIITSIKTSFASITTYEEAVFRNGAKNGKSRNLYEGEWCTRELKNGKINGWQVCEKNNVETSRNYYVNGVKSNKAGKKAQTASYSKECSGLGFTKGTEKHGGCILKLREISALEKSSNSSQTQTLIKDVRQKRSDADKLLGLSMMLNALNKGSNLSYKSSGKEDLMCKNDCLKRNYGYSFCSSVCSY